MDDYLQLKAQLRPGRRYDDGTVGIMFRTAEEIGTEKFAEIDSWRQQNGWLLFRRNQFNEDEVPTEDAKIEGQRTDSQIMRLSLFKLFMLQGGKKPDFPQFYKQEMAKFQQVISDKIEELESRNGR